MTKYLRIFSKRTYNFKLKEGKQEINDIKRPEPSSGLYADPMFFYVETGVEFTNDFGGIDEDFYLNIETTYVATINI